MYSTQTEKDFRSRGEEELINGQTPWRAYLVQGPNLLREDGELKVAEKHRSVPFNPTAFDSAKHSFSPLPPADWRRLDYDDNHWARYHPDDLADYLGDWGVETEQGGVWPSLLCLRTSFGIADPARATDLKLTIVFLGGVGGYVNGQEIGRGYLPPGALTPFTPAEDYPIEAYTTDDGTTPLPTLTRKEPQPEVKWRPRYNKRIRTITLSVPSRVLVKGRNVLAVELHRAAVAGPFEKKGWSHLGFREVKLTSARGGIPYAAACKGPHVWSADAVEQVAETLASQSLTKRSWFWTMYWGRGMPVKGVQQGNPFAPIMPMRLTMPRNGVGSGQTVISDPEGLHGVTATLDALKGPSGAVLPANGVQIRFAVQHPGLHYCDALMEKAKEGVKTIPVWVIVQAPNNQPPGCYVSTLHLTANGKSFSVPVQVLVTGYTLPDAKNFSSTIGFTHSPETVAKHYQVELWSEAHFLLMEKTFALLGQVGNDIVHVPVIVSGVGGKGKSGVKFDWQPLIRWVKTNKGLTPDFSILEKYLDIYTKYCAPPRALSLYIWGASSAKEWADAYEGRQIPSKENLEYKPPRVHVWDPQAKTTSEVSVPIIGDEGSEQFWKPMLEGVRKLVNRRGWSERIIMLALGGDIRPGQKTAEPLRQWAPYARWNLLSHFSADPGSSYYRGPHEEALKTGKLIAVGGLEIGVKEWGAWTSSLTLPQFEERIIGPFDFLELPTDRWRHQEYSPPLIFRTIASNWGCLGRIGLDFWDAKNDGPRSTSFFSHVESLTVPGPDGPLPTVRFQMLRESVIFCSLRF